MLRSTHRAEAHVSLVALSCVRDFLQLSERRERGVGRLGGCGHRTAARSRQRGGTNQGRGCGCGQDRCCGKARSRSGGGPSGKGRRCRRLGRAFLRRSGGRFHRGRAVFSTGVASVYGLGRLLLGARLDEVGRGPSKVVTAAVANHGGAALVLFHADLALWAGAQLETLHRRAVVLQLRLGLLEALHLSPRTEEARRTRATRERERVRDRSQR